jgi:hypothetical protein
MSSIAPWDVHGIGSTLRYPGNYYTDNSGEVGITLGALDGSKYL